MRVYVAGPMTGIPDFNFPAFHAATLFLRSKGFEVINPAEVNPDTTMSWADCMRRDIPELLTCDALCALEGWSNSKGARLEMEIASKLEMKISFYPQLPTARNV